MQNRTVRGLSFSIVLMILVATQGFAFQRPPVKNDTASSELVGRWKVTFSTMGLEKNLILVSRANGVASFMLLDTGPDNKPVPDPKPAVWSRLTNNRISFSGDAELPIGTCCREIGTMIFKGKFTSHDTIAGKLIFVTSVDEDESPYKLHSIVGTFTASRLSN